MTITILPCLHNTDLKVPTRALRQEKINTYSVRICYKSSIKNKLNCHSLLAVNITVALKTQQILYGDNCCMLITIFNCLLKLLKQARTLSKVTKD